MAGNDQLEIVDRVLKDLPNFPRDIVEQWIGYYAHSEGWPPPDPLTGRWANLLDGHPLRFWQFIRWTEELLSPMALPFTEQSRQTILEIISANTRNSVNSYSLFMGEEGKPRFMSLLKFIIQNGRPPKNPIVIRQGRYYDVMDGNHRLAAYITWSQWCQIDECVKKLGFTPATLPENISIWVGVFDSQPKINS
jgi:hypothetical protein